MRRADRLFRLVQLLRGGRLWTAARLAAASEVSERTIYRDIADLQASGVPIEGEAGVGYVMRAGFDLPPLMFTASEVAALALGARLVAAWGGADMVTGARDALSKIEAVLPEARVMADALTRLGAPPVGLPDALRARLDRLDAAIGARRVVHVAYRDPNGAETSRDLRPLALWFWGRDWTMVAWCELRDDFRMFRVDRIVEMVETERTFPSDPARGLAQFLQQVAETEGCRFPPDPLAKG